MVSVEKFHHYFINFRFVPVNLYVVIVLYHLVSCFVEYYLVMQNDMLSCYRRTKDIYLSLVSVQ